MGLECAFFLLGFFTKWVHLFSCSDSSQLVVADNFGGICPIVDSRHLALDCGSHLRPPKFQLDALMQAFGGQ